MGEVKRPQPEYRLALARDGYVLERCEDLVARHHEIQQAEHAYYHRYNRAHGH